MEYKCEIVSASKLIATPLGFISSLCDKCKTLDCSNPIEKKKMSVIGIQKEVRVLVRGGFDYYVCSCQGFSQ